MKVEMKKKKTFIIDKQLTYLCRTV